MSRALAQDDPNMLRGWTAIIRQLRVGKIDTAVRYARRNVDPLPIVVVQGVPSAVPQYLDEWWARTLNHGVTLDGEPLERAEGIKAIVDLTGISRPTVYRLAERAVDPLSIHRSGNGSRWAYVTALRDFLDRQTIPFRIHDRLSPRDRFPHRSR